MTEESSEQEQGSSSKEIEAEIKKKATKFVESDPLYGGKLCHLILPSSALHVWEDRPVIDATKEPLLGEGSETEMVISQDAEGFMTYISLDVTPGGMNKEGLNYVYSLQLLKGASPSLLTYIKKSTGEAFEDGEYHHNYEAPKEVSTSTLRAFNDLLGEAWADITT